MKMMVKPENVRDGNDSSNRNDDDGNEEMISVVYMKYLPKYLAS